MSNWPPGTSPLSRAFVAAALFAASLSVASRPVEAAEQIVLPYECNIVGGRVTVRPSTDQAYRIFGERRQEQYRACSEQNPGRCRTFLVHRFTMACGRDRAEWPDVYAAIAKVTDGRAFYNNDGALYYRMGPREPRDSYPFPEPRRATGIVEMPEGFAPMAGVDAIFTPLDPRVAELEEEAAPAPRDEPGFAPALTPKAAPESKAPTAPKIIEAPKPASPPESPNAEPPAETAAAPAAPPPAPEPPKPDAKPPEAKPPEDKAPEAKPADTAAAPAPVAPTILNNPAAKQVETASKTETIVAAAEIAPPPPATTETGSTSRVEGWSAPGGSGLAVPPLAFAVLIAAATLAALLVILKKQAETPVAAGPVRVPVEPTLPGLETPASTSTARDLVVRDQPDPPALAAAGAVTTDMPVTREDALAVLGLSAGASDAAIRKVVEALRQSWHPDLASGEEDRAAREVRIKVINVAAGILLQRSAA